MSSLTGLKNCKCGKESKFVCSKCKSGNYCSRECQKKDWIEHKKIHKIGLECPKDCNTKHASHVTHIDDETHAEIDKTFLPIYLVSKDKKRYLPAGKDAPKAIPYHSIIWSSPEEVEEQKKRWMTGLPVI